MHCPFPGTDQLAEVFTLSYRVTSDNNNKPGKGGSLFGTCSLNTACQPFRRKLAFKPSECADSTHEHDSRSCSPPSLLLFVRFREYANPILMDRFSRIWRPVICLVAYTNDASNPISDQGGWPLRWTSTLGPEWPREHHLSPSAHRVRITRIPTSVRTTKPQLHVLLRDYAKHVNQTLRFRKAIEETLV